MLTFSISTLHRGAKGPNCNSCEEIFMFHGVAFQFYVKTFLMSVSAFTQFMSELELI